jgi:folate-binding Fe-S cluster repair protein YgfZ
MNHLLGAVGNGTLRAVLTPQASKRQLIQLRGPDTFKFLQSMSTKKVMSIVEAEDSGEFCDFASFLTNKGRVLSEALMMFRTRSKTWMLDVPITSVPPLIEHFKQYKMRNNIMIDTEEANMAYKVWTLVATSEKNLKELSLWLLNKTSQMELMFYQDPRFPLSLRILSPSHIHRTL